MRVCREINEWITENVERPLESWVEETERQCIEQPCNWWCLCCNKWFCFLVTLLVRIVTWVVVTITRLVTTVVCEIVGFALDVGAFLTNLILTIPALGGFLRTVLNWISEIVWRASGLLDFVLTLIGVQILKKMYVKVIILNDDGKPLTEEASVIPFIETAKSIFRIQCNVNMIYTGVCVPRRPTPQEALDISCDAGGFFSDWWLAGSYYELVSAECAFKDGWRRVTGFGAEVIVFIINNVTDFFPRQTIGCSMGATHNYVLVEAGNMLSLAHEIGHCCGLLHFVDTTNLMNPDSSSATTGLVNWQRAIFRNSRHVVFL